jgi:hypothetical protein
MHPDALEERHVPGQERLADVEARELFAFEDDRAMAHPGHQRRECGSAGSAAANDRVDLGGEGPGTRILLPETVHRHAVIIHASCRKIVPIDDLSTCRSG